jgi:putative DNA primase/helicase
MTKPSISQLIQQVAQCALAQSHTLVLEWLPEGVSRGAEWSARNYVRGDREPGSFNVSLDTGRWNDFADPDAHGGDLVSLLAYLRQCTQSEAAKEIDARLGLGLFLQNNSTTKAPVMIDQAKIDARIEQRDKEANERRQRAEKNAVRIWAESTPADANHPYLKKKGIPPFSLRQTKDGVLLIPLGIGGRLVNLQMINQQCEKRFLSGGQVKGCFCPIGIMTPDCRIYICEGWATGASVHKATGCPVICAMTAANLDTVATSIRASLGSAVELIIAGDDDRNTEGNPGKAYALRAALNCNAKVVFPVWPVDAPRHLTDFNDLDLWQRAQQCEDGAHD